ncbi:MAG TPA: penicillin-insensitive murein endopeptidase [Polyangiaceae bacterium]|jgi:penicillin-insensitive murein endopeptidase|nr:penicillin-insensitive murein endopeptidase [Polyangiaceae bacterium]
MLDSTARARGPLRKKAPRAAIGSAVAGCAHAGSVLTGWVLAGCAHAGWALAGCVLAGCANAPSPLTPAWHGSIGLPGRGVLASGSEVRRDAQGLVWLRGNDRHWALPRFARAIERAAGRVAEERPGGTLSIGDVSTRTGGGPLPPHFSHRSGRDADLLFYVSTLEGAPVASPGFIHVGADGIARDEAHKRWLRLDVEREWLLVKALLTDPDARIQWVFVSDVVKALLVERALARGEPTELVARAQEVMLEPHPGGVHDDHIHIRTACSPEEIVAGCVPNGPARRWLANEPVQEASEAEDRSERRGGTGDPHLRRTTAEEAREAQDRRNADADLVRALLEPSAASAAPAATYAALPANRVEPIP